MGNRKWQESSNGPDWMDVAAVLRAIEQAHRVQVFVGLSCGDTDGASFDTHFFVLSDGKDASVMGQPAVAMSGAWPCSEHKTLTACLYAGLLKLDMLISKDLYRQGDLFV